MYLHGYMSAPSHQCTLGVLSTFTITPARKFMLKHCSHVACPDALRYKQRLVDSGIAVLIVAPYEDDNWDAYGTILHTHALP